MSLITLTPFELGMALLCSACLGLLLGLWLRSRLTAARLVHHHHSGRVEQHTRLDIHHHHHSAPLPGDEWKLN